LVVSRTCKATTEQSQPCQAAPLKGSNFCFMHDPDHAEDAKRARELGGVRRRREGTVAAAYEFDGLETIPQVRRLVEVAVIDTLGLENSISRNRTLAYLAQVAVNLLEKGEQEHRLAAIEAALGPRVIKHEPGRR
jgi:hypothetical protein